MALDDLNLGQLSGPDFGEAIVRTALAEPEAEQGLHRAIEVLGRAFLSELDKRLSLETLAPEDQAAVRDAVRTHLGRVRIKGEKIARRNKGFHILLSKENFDREELKGIQEFVDSLQMDLFLALLETKLQVVRLMRELEKTQAIAEARAHDDLTRLPTRKYGSEKVRLKVERDPKKALGVLLVDIDHFKKINDTLGHPAGDTILRAVARTISEQLHMEDIALRYGGEEIFILLDVENREQVVKIAQRLRRAIAYKVPNVTVSIGAEFAPGEEILMKTPQVDPDANMSEDPDPSPYDMDGFDTSNIISNDNDSRLPQNVNDQNVDTGSSVDQEYLNTDSLTNDPDLFEDDGQAANSQSLDFDITGPATQRADNALYLAKDKDTPNGRNRVWAAWKDEAEPRDWKEESAPEGK